MNYVFAGGGGVVGREKALVSGGGGQYVYYTDMNYVFPWGLVGSQKVRVNGVGPSPY